MAWFYPDRATDNEGGGDPQVLIRDVLVRCTVSTPTIFEQLAWPPNPENVRLATVLQALGWSMSVQSVDGGVEVRVWNAEQRLPNIIERTPPPPAVQPVPADSLSDDSQ